MPDTQAPLRPGFMLAAQPALKVALARTRAAGEVVEIQWPVNSLALACRSGDGVAVSLLGDGVAALAIHPLAAAYLEAMLTDVPFGRLVRSANVFGQAEDTPCGIALGRDALGAPTGSGDGRQQRVGNADGSLRLLGVRASAARVRTAHVGRRRLDPLAGHGLRCIAPTAVDALFRSRLAVKTDGRTCLACGNSPKLGNAFQRRSPPSPCNRLETLAREG